MDAAGVFREVWLVLSQSSLILRPVRPVFVSSSSDAFPPECVVSLSSSFSLSHPLPHSTSALCRKPLRITGT